MREGIERYYEFNHHSFFLLHVILVHITYTRVVDLVSQSLLFWDENFTFGISEYICRRFGVYYIYGEKLAHITFLEIYFGGPLDGGKSMVHHDEGG